MFTNIQGFEGMSGAQQFLLEMTCHWLPGVLALGAAWVAYMPSAGCRPARPPRPRRRRTQHPVQIATPCSIY